MRRHGFGRAETDPCCYPSPGGASRWTPFKTPAWAGSSRQRVEKDIADFERQIRAQEDLERQVEQQKRMLRQRLYVLMQTGILTVSLWIVLGTKLGTEAVHGNSTWSQLLAQIGRYGLLVSSVIMLSASSVGLARSSGREGTSEGTGGWGAPTASLPSPCEKTLMRYAIRTLWLALSLKPTIRDIICGVRFKQEPL